MREMLDLVRAAEKVSPKEICGAFVRNPDDTVSVVPMENSTSAPDRFEAVMTPELAKNFDSIVAFYHSHAGDPYLSQADVDACHAIEVPYYVVSAARAQVCSYAPKPAPLIGRPYVWGLYDCSTLIRDAWTLVTGEAPLQRHPSLRDWKDKKFGFDTLLTQYGFKQVNRPQPGDVLLFRQNTQARRPHSALFLEGGMLLEHVQGECSRRRPMTSLDLAQPYGIFRCASPSTSTALSRICTMAR